MKPRHLLAPLMFSLGLATLAQAAIPADYKGTPFKDDFHSTPPPNIPGIVQCGLYDLGGEGVAFHDTTPANEGSGGLNRETTPYNHMRAHGADYVWHFRENEGLDLSYVKDWADLNHPNFVNPQINQFYIGWASDDEWANYTVNVTEPGVYAVKCLYTYPLKEVTKGADGKPVGKIFFQLNGKHAADVTLPRDTGHWHVWDYGTIATITLPEAGPQLLTFNYCRGNNWAYWIFEKIGEVPAKK